jgi:hypothetical protein
MLNDREELCECLFCDCVFPSAEAIEISANPGAYTFPNVPQEKRDGVRKYNVTPVYPDPVPLAVKRAETTPTMKVEKNPYEVSPDDIKAPRKTLWLIVGMFAAAVALVVAIFLPLYFERMNHRNAMSNSISTVFTEFTVDKTKTDSYYVGFSMSGQKNNVLHAATGESITNDQILITFENFARLRAEEYNIKSDNFSDYYGDITLTVYAANGSFSLDVNEKGDLTADQVEHSKD